MTPTPNPGSAALSEVRFLRRWTYVFLLACISIAGLAGVSQMLLTGKTLIAAFIFATVLLVVLASLLILSVTALTEKRRINIWFLRAVVLGVGIHTLLSVASIWWPGFRWRDEVFASDFAFFAAVALSIPVAMAQCEGHIRISAVFGFGVILLAYLWTMGGIWIDLPSLFAVEKALIAQIGLTLWILAVIPAYTGIMLTIEPGNLPRALRLGVIAAGVLNGIAAAVFVMFDFFESELAQRLLLGCIFITIILTLLAAIFGRFNAARRRRALGAAVPLELTCPACRSAQTLTTGDSACSQCGCAFSIRITPRDCLFCGYSLANLRDRVCPECGTAF